MEAPPLFRCPISMELMENPVTISTGVTYEKKNIEKWLFTYKKSTCPATMQRLQTFDLTPNHTLKRLIQSWLERTSRPPPSPSPPPRSSASDHNNLVSLLSAVESEPFKVRLLKKLGAMIGAGGEMQADFVESGGIQVLSRIMSQVGVESAELVAFRACEEAVGVLHQLPLTDEMSVVLLTKPECLKPMMVLLQRGSADSRVRTMEMLQNISRFNKDWCEMVSHQDVDVFKLLLELLSDEISTKLSSCSLDVLIEIVSASKKNRIKAVQAGAVCILIDLLPDATRHKCERILFLLKRLCECPEGRSAFAEHGLGVAAVSKKILRVSEVGTKLGVKILWQMCCFSPMEKVLEDMMVMGSVQKLLRLLHVDGRSSTKDKALRMIRLHGAFWKQYACFPSELKEFV